MCCAYFGFRSLAIVINPFMESIFDDTPSRTNTYIRSQQL